MSDGDPQRVHEAWILPYKPNAPYKFPRGDKNRGLVPRECLNQDPITSDNTMQTGGLGSAVTGISDPLLLNLECVETTEDLREFFKFRNPSKGQLRVIRDIARKEALRQLKRLRAAAMRKRCRVNVFKNLIKFLNDESEIAIYFDKAFRRQKRAIHRAVTLINLGCLDECSRNIFGDEMIEIIMEVIRNNRYELNIQVESAFAKRYMCVYKVEPKSMYLITRFKLNNEEYDFIIKGLVYEPCFDSGKRFEINRHLQRAKNINGSLLTAVKTVTNSISTENNQTKNQVNDSDDDDDVCYVSDESCKHIIEIDDSDAENENSGTKAIKLEKSVMKIDKEYFLRMSNIKEEPMENASKALEVNKTVNIKSEKNTTHKEITKVNKNPALVTSSMKPEKLIQKMGTIEPKNESSLNYKLKTVMKSDENMKIEEDNKPVDTENTEVRVCNIKAEKESDMDSTAKLTKESSSKVNLKIKSEKKH